MLVVIIKPDDKNALVKLQTLLNRTKLKKEYIINNSLILIPFKTYNENTYLITNILLKYLEESKQYKYSIKVLSQSLFARVLKKFMTEYIKQGLLKIPVKPLYFIGDCPACFQLLTYELPQVTEEHIIKIKNIGSLEFFTKLKASTTMCINPTRTYTYPFNISTPLLLASMRSKINYNTPNIEPNIINIILDSKHSETVVYLINKRQSITIKKVSLNNDEAVNTLKIKSNYTHELNELDEKYSEQVKKFIIQTDLPRLTGEFEYITKCSELLNLVNNPDTFLKNFRKIKVKYYMLENDRLLIDTITLLSASREITSIINTHLLKQTSGKLALVSQNYYKIFNTYKDYIHFLKNKFQSVVVLRNKTLLLV